MLKMNYSDFLRKTNEQINKAAQKRGIDCYRMGRDDIIGRIIAHDAYYEGVEMGKRNPNCETPNKRNKYHLSDYYGNDYYLSLTQEQVNFLNWMMVNDLLDVEFKESGNIEYVAP